MEATWNAFGRGRVAPLGGGAMRARRANAGSRKYRIGVPRIGRSPAMNTTISPASTTCPVSSRRGFFRPMISSGVSNSRLTS